MYEDHKSHIPGVGLLVTSWDGAESNFVAFEDMKRKEEQPHFVITVYEDEDMEKVAYWVHLKPGTTQEDADEQAAAHPKTAVAEWVTVKSLQGAA